MGYDFSFEQETPDRAFRMTSSEMSMMREFMREVGAVVEPGTKRAMSGPEPIATSAPIQKFKSNDNQLVTPDECRTIAERLVTHVDVILDVASFFDDAPPGPETRTWVLAWADYNARAAGAGGYRVR
jgi:hypothetical protein